MENKITLRTHFKSIRKTLDRNMTSKSIIGNIIKFEVYKKAKRIMLFYPTKYEIDLRELTKDSTKKFYYPRVSGENILVCPNIGEFKKSDFGIFEPTSEPINPKELDLIFVPALAADKNRYRLGYGGGYYDRFLRNNPNITTITPIFKELITETLPTEEFDMKIDYIITD